MSKNKNKARIPALPEPQSNLLQNSEVLLLGFDKKQGDQVPNVGLRYIDTEYECFSDWNKGELKALSSFLRKMAQTTWTDVLKSGGNGANKAGFGYTVHKDRDKLPRQKHLDQFSQDITFFELRVTQKARIHGFRVKSVFFAIFLDKDHRVYPV